MTQERDFYTDRSVLLNPYDWFEELRAQGPICKMANRDLILVTGYEESVEVLNNMRDWSSAISVSGPLLPLPFEPEGDDITDQIEANRHLIPASDLLAARDGTPHANSRALIAALFTPSRLKANHDYITGVADEMVRRVAAKGGCELMSEISSPFVTYVVSDILGVPVEDRDEFRRIIDLAPPPGNMEAAPPPGKEVEWAARAMEMQAEAGQNSPLAQMAGYFARYIAERRAAPSGDVLSEFAHSAYPDATQPDLGELVRLSMFLFGAGQDTSAKLIGNAFRYLVDVPGLQEQLRADPKLIPAFVEECLRLEGSIKTVKRLALRRVNIAGVDIEPGTKVVIGIAAANRDPRRWENPTEFRLDRPGAKQHLSFGRGGHTCAGAPLARAEVRVIFEKLLEHTSYVGLCETEHGPAHDRRWEFEPSFSIRGFSKLHAVLEPA